MRGDRPGVIYFTIESTPGVEPDMPPPRRDYYSARKWKANPVPPGEHPYRFNPVRNEIDLHPSQWSRR